MTTTIKNPKPIKVSFSDQLQHNVDVQGGKIQTQPLTDAIIEWAIKKWIGPTASFTATAREVAIERGELLLFKRGREVSVRTSGDKLIVKVTDRNSTFEWFQLPKQD